MRRSTVDGDRVRVVVLVMAAALAVGPLLLGTPPARAAAPFVVNSILDVGDATPDGICDSNPTAGVRCTLREAIQEANAAAGADTIAFNIGGSGVRTIAPTAQLPRITDPVTFDGYTQPGSSPNSATDGTTNAVLRIFLSGANAAPFTASRGVIGLLVSGGGTTIRGLVINGFRESSTGSEGDGIVVFNLPGNVIAGNFIGTDAAGAADVGNQGAGVRIAIDTTIGWTSPADRNVISGNDNQGILANSDGHRVQGNLIGTDRLDVNNLGNAEQGIAIIARANSTIGGNNAAAANTVAFNGKSGIFVSFDVATGHQILRNSIFGNGELGIDLDGGTENAAGVTANDPGDGDTGPNQLQNKPNLDAATSKAGQTTVDGLLSSTPTTAFVLRFYVNPANETEGKRFLGQRSITTDATGRRTFSVPFGVLVAAGQRITATATDPGGNTSEFSNAQVVI